MLFRNFTHTAQISISSEYFDAAGYEVFLLDHVTDGYGLPVLLESSLMFTFLLAQSRIWETERVTLPNTFVFLWGNDGLVNSEELLTPTEVGEALQKFCNADISVISNLLCVDMNLLVGIEKSLCHLRLEVVIVFRRLWILVIAVDLVSVRSAFLINQGSALEKVIIGFHFLVSLRVCNVCHALLLTS